MLLSSNYVTKLIFAILHLCPELVTISLPGLAQTSSRNISIQGISIVYSLIYQFPFLWVPPSYFFYLF